MALRKKILLSDKGVAYEAGCGCSDTRQWYFGMLEVESLAASAVNRCCKVGGPKRQIYPKARLYLQQIAKASRFCCAPKAFGKDCEYES